MGVTTGLDPQAVEITEVQTPADNLTAAVRYANPSLVPILNRFYLFSKNLKLNHSLYFRGISENISSILELVTIKYIYEGIHFL